MRVQPASIYKQEAADVNNFCSIYYNILSNKALVENRRPVLFLFLHGSDLKYLPKIKKLTANGFYMTIRCL